VQLPGGSGRPMGDYPRGAIEPLRGSPDDLAGELRAFAAAGATHVQVVLDPITRHGVESFADILAALDA
jgi:hypothetical protein